MHKTTARLANSSWKYLCFFSRLFWRFCNLSLTLMRFSQELKEHYPLHAHTYMLQKYWCCCFIAQSRDLGSGCSLWEAGAYCGGLVSCNQNKTGCGHQASGYKPVWAKKQNFQLNLEENICPWCKTNLIVPTSNNPAFSPLRGLSPAPRGRILPVEANSPGTSTAVSPYTTEV